MPDVSRNSMIGEVATTLGRVILRPAGKYKSGQTYDRLDLVRHDGSGWICLKDGTTTAPIDGTDWMLYVEQGDSGNATLAQSWAEGGTGVRAGEDTNNAKYYSEQSQKSATSASESVQIIEENADGIKTVKDNLDAILSAKNNADSAAESAQSSMDDAARAENAANLSESWAVGGTGSREGEDENNSKYWADQAQAYAEQVKTPIEGVYNVVLVDSITQDRYALVVDDGRLALLGVSDDIEAAHMVLIDHKTGVSYAVIVEDGKLKLEEAV